MSQDLDDADHADIKQGFICSECKESFSAMNDLIIHFNTIHEPNSDVSPKDESRKSSPKKKPSRTVQQPVRPQVIGLTTSHKEYFFNMRESRASYQRDQISALLCRLNKLTTIDDEDALEKKSAFEKQVVDWVDDQYVPLCPSCGKAFNLTRRRHHCRLCGAIMCQPCSEFIEYDTARKLVRGNEDDHEDDPDDDFDGNESRRSEYERPHSGGSTSSPLTKSIGHLAQIGSALGSSLKTSIRRGSTTSLLSVVAQSTKDQTSIRICHDCKVVLDKRARKVDNSGSITLISALYSKLQERMVDCEKAIPNYEKISASFNGKDMNSSGLLGYDYEEAQELRIKLIRMAEDIDLISRKINTLGVTDATPPPVTQIQLQSKIRMAATNFLKNKTLGMASLPSPEEVKAMREKRREQLQKESTPLMRKSDSNGRF